MNVGQPFTGTVNASGTGSTSAPARSWAMLLFLVAVYSCNWMDRYVVTILLEPMKRELRLSDGQMGFISGFAFAVAYSVAGLAMGRLADRAPRRLMLSLVIAAWSLSTMITGLARGFTSLILARFGVAIFESGCSPTAYSLISDSFPTRLRARAISIYALGIYLGLGAGLLVGGLVSDMFGWRLAFVVVGLPGLLLALIGWLFMAEPARGELDLKTPNEAASPHELQEQNITTAFRNPALLAATFALGLMCLATGSFEGWTPAWLIREAHFTAAQAGALTGLSGTLAGMGGTLLVGLLCDRLGRKDSRWYFWLPIMGAALYFPSVELFSRASGAMRYFTYFAAILGGATYVAPMFTLGQLLLPQLARIRSCGDAAHPQSGRHGRQPVRHGIAQ